MSRHALQLIFLLFPKKGGFRMKPIYPPQFVLLFQ